MRGIKPSLVLASVAVVGLCPLGRRPVRAVRESHGCCGRPVSEVALGGAGGQGRVSRTTRRERLDWHFIPRARKGLPIKELSPEQRRWRSA